MTSRVELSRQALKAASNVRIAAKLAATSPLCVYDLIQQHFRDEIELRFQALPSLEGMYSKTATGSVIIVSSLRPSGRRRFTAGHELGHHVFGHGTRLDELVAEDRAGAFSPEEYLADCFSAFLQMPKLAVLKAFKSRGLDISQPSPLDVYRVASFFGVGYTSLLTHLAVTLGILRSDAARQLAKASPKAIRTEVLGMDWDGELHLVDARWDSGRAIDLMVGDAVLLPAGARVEGERLAALTMKRHDGELFEAVSPGIGRLEHACGWSAYVRVERREYAGRALFRHEEECDD
jgi:Zn-dependent peptidase ImmA (M78 family)